MKKYLLKFEKLFLLFREYNVDFAIHNDIAIYLWGVRKKIRYVDIIIDFNEENIERFVRLMKNMGMKIKKNIRYKFLPELLKEREKYEDDYLIFYHRRILPWRIKLWLKDSLRNYSTVEKKIGEVKVPVVSLEDLVNFKRKKLSLKEIQDFHFMKNILSDILEKVP